MRRFLSVLLAGMLALGALVLPSPSRAAEGDADEEGIPAYSVARLKIFQGTAWVRSPDSGEWEESTTNAPVTERSRVNIPEGSESEIQFHGGQFVLLTGGTEVDIRKFDEANTVFRLRSGEIRFDLPPEDFSPVRVLVPGGGKADFQVPGRYWLTVQEDGRTQLVVRSGESVVSVERGEFGVKAGQVATIDKEVRIAAYEGAAGEKYEPPPPLTDEERAAEVPPAAAYELREYGDWVQSEDYGWVWQPRVVSGWTPYYYGSWSWVSPYGWNWVSYEPWGWYPYHFGWWAVDPLFGWVWCPYRSFVSVGFVFGNSRFTHFHRNVFFSPANVRFVRDGRNVRWVPLRPGERFVRSGFTRADARLARWERPLERGTVFTRTERGGKREWREWTSSRKDRQTVVVRERGTRQGGISPARPGREERSTVRQPAERTRPAERLRPERQERMQQRAPDRPSPQREFRERRGSSGDRGGASSSSVRRPDADSRVRPERVRPRDSDRQDRVRPSTRGGGENGRYEKSVPSSPRRQGGGSEARPQSVRPLPQERFRQEGPSRRMEAPPARVRERREIPSIRREGPRAGPPAGNPAYAPGFSRPERSPRNIAPDRGPRRPDRSMAERAPAREAPRSGDFRNPGGARSFNRGEQGGPGFGGRGERGHGGRR
jgi:hypothetical protein